MKKYNCAVFTQKEIKALCGKEIIFKNGFPQYYKKDSPDYWNILEEHIGAPVISIREDGRYGWNEVIVLFADGYLDGDKRIIEGDLAYIIKCLQDIFTEAENDECEVFEWYDFKTDESTKESVLNWMRSEYDYEG